MKKSLEHKNIKREKVKVILKRQLSKLIYELVSNYITCANSEDIEERVCWKSVGSCQTLII